jgi:hypothetical protein
VHDKLIFSLVSCSEAFANEFVSKITSMIALRSVRSKWKCPVVMGVRNKTFFYRIIIASVVILSAIYLVVFTTSHISDISHYTKLLQRPGDDEDYGDDAVEEVIDENYFVKTSGCRIVKMEVMSEQIR